MGIVKIVPCLDMKGGRVVKGIHFVNLRDAGDPVEAPGATARRVPTRSPSSIYPPRSREGRR